MENKKYSYVLVNYKRGSAEIHQTIDQVAHESFDCDGIEEFSLEEKRVDEILGERAYSGGDIPESLIDEVEEATVNQDSFTISYYFYEGDHEENAANFVEFVKSHYPDLSLSAGKADHEDWLAEWKKFYRPIIVSERIEIIPEWFKTTYKSSADYKIYIWPGMGFGTGTHETTYLCLKLYDQVMNELKNDSSCLDFGCGSGILGIAALKSKRMPTLFCDIDKSALDNCVQNLLLNFEGENLHGTSLVIRTKFTPGPKYNLVFANILENVLLLEKETLLSSLAPGGYLIVSGLLNHQVENIVSIYNTLEKISVVSKNDWSAILFKGKV